jgi:hypothetical protein
MPLYSTPVPYKMSDREVSDLQRRHAQSSFITAYHTNTQLGLLANNDPDTTSAFTKRRDDLWTNQNKDYYDTLRQQKLGLNEETIQGKQIDAMTKAQTLIEQSALAPLNVAKTSAEVTGLQNKNAAEEALAPITRAKALAELKDLQNKNAAEEALAPITRAKALAELKDLQNKNDLSAIQLEQKKYLLNVLTSPTPQRVVEPSSKLASDLKSAKSIEDAGPAWSQLNRLATDYNVPAKSLQRLYIGRLAITYQSPRELAEDIGVKLPQTPIDTFQRSDIAEHADAINNAINSGMTPDDALKSILKETGLSKGDKNYPQTVLNISLGIIDAYKADGESALAETQKAIAESETATLNRLAPRMNEVTVNSATPEGVRDLLAGQQQRFDQLMQTAEQAAATGDKDDMATSVALKQKAFQEIGFASRPLNMSAEQIKQAAIRHMIDTYQGDPQSRTFLEAQLDPAKRNPDFDQYLAPIVPEFRKGAKAFEVKEAQEQDKRDKITKEATDKGLVTRFNPNDNKPVFFTTAAQADQYDRAPAADKPAIAAGAQALTEAQLSNPNYMRFIKKSDKDKDAIIEDLQTGTDILASTDILDGQHPLFKKYNVLTKDELRFRLNELAKINGQPEIPAPEEPPPTDSWHLSHLWNWIGEKQKPETPVAATTQATQPTAETPDQAYIKQGNALLQRTDLTPDDRRMIQEKINAKMATTPTTLATNTPAATPQQAVQPTAPVSTTSVQPPQPVVAPTPAPVSAPTPTPTGLDAYSPEIRAQIENETPPSFDNTEILKSMGGLVLDAAGNEVNRQIEGAKMTGLVLADMGKNMGKNLIKYGSIPYTVAKFEAKFGASMLNRLLAAQEQRMIEAWKLKRAQELSQKANK